MIPRSLSSRIRKTIKWGGAAVTVLLVVVWIGSAWAGLSVRRGERFARIEGGGFVFERIGSVQPVNGVFWLPAAAIGPFRVMPEWEDWPTNGSISQSRPAMLLWRVFVPLWMPVLAVFVPTFVLWRFDARAVRRERLGRCPKGNYDRAGLGGIGAGAVCPECGDCPSSTPSSSV